MCQIVKPINGAIFHFVDDIIYGDTAALIAEVGAAF
jgi:hypothetical protein